MNIEVNSSTPIAMIQCWLNTMDKTVRSVTVVQTRWWPSCVVITCDILPAHLWVWSSSIHFFYICITVIAACHVEAEMSQYNKLAFWRPIILPSLNSLMCWWHKRHHCWAYVYAISQLMVVHKFTHLLNLDFFGPFFLDVALFANNGVLIFILCSFNALFAMK